MAKRSLSPVHLPPAKRAHLSSTPSTSTSIPPVRSGAFETLYDELILHIFTFLSYTDLCALQPTNRNWARLSLDNQLWKKLYLREFGRLRLRGSRGFAGRRDGRETKNLPSRVVAAEEIQDWKRMFRISTNWRSGRCRTSVLDEMSTFPLSNTLQGPAQQAGTSGQEQVPQITFAGKYTIISSPDVSHSPSILVLSPSVPKHVIHVVPIRGAQQPVRVTAIAVDQSSSRSTANLHIAACLSNGEIHVHELHSPTRKHHYAPPFKTPRTAPIVQAAYCHPVLVTLSESFSLSMYDLSHETIQVIHVLTSFTSFPPSSLVLTMPESQTYKLFLTYASPVYPAHWSVGVTEVILSSAALHYTPASPFTSPTSTRPTSLSLSTRSTRAFDIPAGWIDEAKLRAVRKQWGRKVGSVAGTQTDGRWVVLAPAVQGEARPPGGFTPASFPLQLYRLSSPPLRAGGGAAPKLTFVRCLLGHTGPVSALALADGRCVSLGVDGTVWVWDLENGRGTEVASSACGVSSPSESDEGRLSTARGMIAFDERRIITAGSSGGVIVRDFDV